MREYAVQWETFNGIWCTVSDWYRLKSEATCILDNLKSKNPKNNYKIKRRINTNNCTANEIFVGNIKATSVPQEYLQFKGARIGVQAFKNNGEPLDPNIYRPLFIDRSNKELFDRWFKNFAGEIDIINE